MWPGFNSRTQCHIWVEFVVSSCPCSERFFSGQYSGLPLSSKTHIPNSNLIWNLRATGLSVVTDCMLSVTLIKQSCLFTFLFYTMNSQYDQLPVGLIAQLVKHGTDIVKVMGFSPVQT